MEILLDASRGLLPVSKESGLGDSNEPSGNILTRERAYLNRTALAFTYAVIRSLEDEILRPAPIYPMRYEDAKAIMGHLKSLRERVQ
jgi:hypothetical protein